jgi:hypothetical protein
VPTVADRVGRVPPGTASGKNQDRLLQGQKSHSCSMYFVVGDQIIIVDRNHRIIAIIDV